MASPDPSGLRPGHTLRESAILDSIGCRAACPVHTEAGRYARAISDGDLEEAVRIARAHNPLVSACAYICTHPCETACARAAYDEPLSLRGLKRHVIEQIDPATVAPTQRDDRGRGHRIAVIGGGPAGLSAAHDLALLGYPVTVFEAWKNAGGLPAQVIPRFRLPREMLERDIAGIVAIGVEIRTGLRVKREDLLAEAFERVLVTSGLSRSLPLPIPGADLDGVHDGLELLRTLVDDEPAALGERIVVVGGGDTAVDVARTIRRIHPRSRVTLVHRKQTLEGRARRAEAHAARDEGTELLGGVLPVRIAGERQVSGVVVSEVATYRAVDASYSPRARPGTRRELAADTVVVAVGRRGVDLPDGAGVRPTRYGSRLLFGERWAAGGDLGGAGSVIAAVADGQALARRADRDLTGGERRPAMAVPRRDAGPTNPSPQPEGRYPTTTLLASREGRRCLNCWIMVRSRTPGDCLLCGRCAGGCPVGALRLERSEGDPEGNRELSGERMRLVSTGTRCVRCGLCVERCPSGCLELTEVDPGG